jgi:hypothetical protein
MENRDHNLELIGIALALLFFVATYALVALILYTLDVDDKLAAKGFSKLQYRMIIFTITVLCLIMFWFLNTPKEF